ncbi:protein-S-isoprenylcysteine O-methyltransferase [Aquabacter spiritensis]|uniref:Protein-S-isoprenylcysteine O-methyltransferase Ste14 n=1 Tax=Aquabacter spiritensis TaxID=933073 RepID=A0A4R3M8B3_9HYPH|nr:protein-S-isoprenylcysteine O-methyltransferase [Aquabacter spiritensis]TCT07585.1 protein-S-isoprenylcysteine O-methyltransferase Ste14 [Aquabacter spiritensis]
MSLLAFTQIAWTIGVLAWFLIRLPFQLKARRTRVADARRRTARETVLLSISTLGLGLVPALYVATGFPRTLSYAPSPLQVGAGVLVFLAALWLFWRTHKALGRQWSVTLELRDAHRLITSGVYARVRHPMYSAFFLWALAQALLLPNLLAGFSGLIGFGILFFLRVGEEEAMMREAFGAEYDAYCARTKRVVPYLY